MARRVTWAVPGDLATFTGGYAYDRRIIAELKHLGWQVDVVGLGEGFPTPSAAQKASAETLLLEANPNHAIVVDGLAFGVLPEVAARLHRRRPVVALVHHPLALETGLAPDRAAALEQSERAALAAACRVVATSAWTADLLAQRFAVPPDRLAVVLPGTDRVAFSTGSSVGPVRLIAVGAIVPRKGFDILVEALATLRHLDWRLAIVGDRRRDVAASGRLDRLIGRHGLEQRIKCLGTVSPDRLAELYAGADLFVLASRFEGYGMAFAEALAHGLPIVGTTGGATADTVPAAASRLVAPADVASLSEALRELIEDTDRRHALAAAARAAAMRLPTWSQSAAKFSDLLAALT
ncbi:MAG: glycosyltransferase family 4 protein [Alphaproteobacteria bacterium]|nr:glycosyltransferase family 4 protein [Alphaproteobacteria bacterium]MBV8406378.1 glycosyltransferase family 4 protein [Alphaproteobacteria bacterium]